MTLCIQDMCVHTAEKNLLTKRLVDAMKWLNTENITKLRLGIWLVGKTRATFVTTHIMYMVANLIVNIKWIANTETAINTSTERT